ncbi:hypothetical protein AVEN_92066-1, partial [Araneus ventricosus]
DRDRGGLVIRSRLWGQRVPDSEPNSTEDKSCIKPGALQIILMRPNVLPWMWCGSLERMPAQASPSLPGRGSELRGQSQNSPRVASNRTLLYLN